jgi:hypothetical protein
LHVPGEPGHCRATTRPLWWPSRTFDTWTDPSSQRPIGSVLRHREVGRAKDLSAPPYCEYKVFQKKKCVHLNWAGLPPVFPLAATPKKLTSTTSKNVNVWQTIEIVYNPDRRWKLSKIILDCNKENGRHPSWLA